MSAHLALPSLHFMAKNAYKAPARHQAEDRGRCVRTGLTCLMSAIGKPLAIRAFLIFCGVLLVSSAGFAQSISFVQEQQCDSRGTSVTCAFSTAVAAGDALMVVVDPTNATGSAYTLSVSDNLNGAWTEDGSGCFRQDVAQAAVFYYLNSKAGSVTVTVTSSTSTNIWSTIVEYSGIATSTPVDIPIGCKYTDGANGSNFATPSITTTNANDLILVSPAITGTGGTITVASPYTMVGSVQYNRVPIADQIVSSAGAYAGAVFTLQYGGEVLGLITAFKAYAPVAVTVAPGTATLYEGQTQQFTASVTNTSNTAVTWSVSSGPGTITSAGLYTPPTKSSSQQTATVTATSQADTTKSASATVTLMPSYLLTWPTPAAINSGTAISATQLNATASVPGTFAYTPAVGYVPAAGTMTLSLLFTPNDGTDYGGPVPATVQLVVNGNAPIINTVAGNGTEGYSGDGGPATSAEIFGPLGVTFDAAGNYYISDNYNDRIRKVNITTGIISTIAGNGTYGYSGDGGPATSAAIGGTGFIFDAAGNIYIADSHNNRIRKVTASTGIITTIIGTGTAGYSGDGGQASSAELNQPGALAFDAAGNLYISDCGNYVVRKVTASTGVITTIAGTGTAGFAGDGGAATTAEFDYPGSLAFDAAGNLYVSDLYNDRVRKINLSTGLISTVAGGGPAGFIGDGGPATSAYIAWSGGISFDAAGNLYIGDKNNSRIRKVAASTGIMTTIAGIGTNVTNGFAGDGGPATSAELWWPGGAVVDHSGNVYIADRANNRIREIANSGAQVTWPTPAPITSGTALSSTQLDATANVPGTFVYTPAAGTVLAAGVQTLSVTFTPTDSSEYSPVTATVKLIVGTVADSGTITLTVNNITAATTTYGAGSTPESVAAGLAAGVTSNSPVTLSYAGDTLSMVSKTTGASTDYAYTLQTTSYDSQAFSQPSYSSISGSLDGGANSGTSSGAVYEYGLSYYPNSTVKSYSDSPPGTGIMGTWTFNYDTLNRLAGAQDSQPNSSFTNYCWSYDAFGNRTNQEAATSAFQSGSGGASTCLPENPQPLSYNARNQVSDGPIVPAYDSAGDITNDGTNQYLYNADGNICAVQEQQYDGMPVMVGYIYDADGNRVAKGTITTMSCDPSANGFTATANYVVDDAGHQLSELDPDSNGTMAWQHTNVYANGSLMATYDNDGLHFYMNDWLGTRRAQTDYEGVLEQTCSSLPFGDQLSCTNSTQFPTENHFTGKERDAESGNDYFGARYYGSTAGRFLSPDPSGLIFADPTNPQSLNLYGYAENNPMIFIDPSGLWLQINCISSGKDSDTFNGNTVTVHGSTPNCTVYDDGVGAFKGLIPQKPQQGFPPPARNVDPCANASLSAAGVTAQQQIATVQAFIAAGQTGANAGPNSNPLLTFAGSLYGFVEAVHTGGPNDIKNQPGPGYHNQIGIDAGNISFGVTCPFGATFCQAGAGGAQAGSGLLNIITRGRHGHGRPGPIRTFFDSPSDNASIKVGQAMRAAGCQ